MIWSSKDFPQLHSIWNIFFLVCREFLSFVQIDMIMTVWWQILLTKKNHWCCLSNDLEEQLPACRSIVSEAVYCPTCPLLNYNFVKQKLQWGHNHNVKPVDPVCMNMHWEVEVGPIFSSNPINNPTIIASHNFFLFYLFRSLLITDLLFIFSPWCPF